jgi:hypothetical protein
LRISSTSSISEVLLVCSESRSLDWLSFRTSYVGSLVTLFSFNDVKLNDFSIINGSDSLVWVVLDDSRLMNEDIFSIFVIPADETIAILNIEPLNDSGHSLG